MSKRIIKGKAGLSEMLSYVILIAIVISLSIGIFAWLRSMSNVAPPVDCEEGTSISLENTTCDGISLTLVLKNNGRFNVSGVTVTVGNDSQNIPSTYLKDRAVMFASNGSFGNHLFIPEMVPTSTQSITFDNSTKTGAITYSIIRNVQIQPFIVANKQKVYCSQSVIRQQIPDCVI